MSNDSDKFHNFHQRQLLQKMNIFLIHGKILFNLLIAIVHRQVCK